MLRVKSFFFFLQRYLELDDQIEQERRAMKGREKERERRERELEKKARAQADQCECLNINCDKGNINHVFQTYYPSVHSFILRSCAYHDWNN